MRGVKKLEDSNLSGLGISLKVTVLHNLSKERLVEECLINKEANMSLNGAINVDTGKYTGRSPKDKYFVEEDSSKDNLWWGEVNQKVDINVFNELYDKVIDFYNKSDSKTYMISKIFVIISLVATYFTGPVGLVLYWFIIMVH